MVPQVEHRHGRAERLLRLGKESGHMRARSEFAKRLMSLAFERGMTMAELSRASGVHKNTLDGYVNQAHDPTLPKLHAIRDALGCAWEELLGE